MAELQDVSIKLYQIVVKFRDISFCILLVFVIYSFWLSRYAFTISHTCRIFAYSTDPIINFSSGCHSKSGTRDLWPWWENIKPVFFSPSPIRLISQMFTLRSPEQDANTPRLKGDHWTLSTFVNLWLRSYRDRLVSTDFDSFYVNPIVLHHCPLILKLGDFHWRD